MGHKEPQPITLLCRGPCGKTVVARPQGLYGQPLIETHLNGSVVCEGSALPPPPDPNDKSVQMALRLLCIELPRQRVWPAPAPQAPHVPAEPDPAPQRGETEPAAAEPAPEPAAP